MKSKLIVFIFLANCLQLIGQELKGRVLDVFNAPIENAYVFNAVSNAHTHTNFNGTFKVNNSKVGDTIQIGILGFKKQKIVLEKKSFKDLVIVLNTKIFQLKELVLRKEMNALQTIAKLDLQVNPVNSSQELLRKIPGLIIGQHAGGGKAEQIFLRGFDIDHGTDIALSVDGMPINMVSHAHGQGYSDLHFIIPETIQKINFGKGPYDANQGDFNTAGFVNFSTKKSLQKNRVSLEVGQFNSLRTLGMFNLLENKKNEDAYMAIEYISNDGPFDSPQNFSRLNVFGKYTAFLNGKDRVTLTASHFTSRWDASGQIPERAVKNGNIDRFGAIDDTEGGTTSRTNFNVQMQKVLSEESVLKTNIFYSNYNFELFSNFTFFLEDPINGDQIRQFENRDIFGANAKVISDIQFGDIPAKFTKGAGLRYDLINDVALSHTKNRKEIIDRIQLGDVKQTNMYAFFNAEFNLGKFKISPAVRLDYFKFIYNDALQINYETLTKNKAIVTPKFNILFSQNENLQWFLKSGIGFHSNDTRVILQQNLDKILPKAYGMDFGNIWKPVPKMVLNTAVWYLLSEEEFVYVGDAGIVEPSGRSERFGFDFGVTYQFTDWLFLNTDLTYTKARSLENLSGEDFIPLAPDFTMVGGLSVANLGNFSGGLQYRYIDDRPANENNSIVAQGYFIADFNVNYKMNDITLGVAVENIFDIAWNETQFATTSRLQNEINPVEEIHFIPGTPFFAKASIRYTF
ncbi:TonB-dependent receptor, putative [Polaribacter irgensii 23-P]|uniref:TonB-dependent receptor, putative n=1 Tax=Polaribacter irgensii 23-P TaxID=313594 RepID=A4C0W2_9FLAO|nr:TonB-dependent receptor plug domain-containing protein [Polaribacter irgensii]EAR13055.1 TonB-dependent receptor, putative [Polaribacter irgensii 23-P]